MKINTLFSSFLIILTLVLGPLSFAQAKSKKNREVASAYFAEGHKKSKKSKKHAEKSKKKHGKKISESKNKKHRDIASAKKKKNKKTKKKKKSSDY